MTLRLRIGWKNDLTIKGLEAYKFHLCRNAKSLSRIQILALTLRNLTSVN